MCYVGKATKIFIFAIAVLVAVGLVLGFGVFRHGLQKNHKCSGDACNPPVFTDPIPATPVTPATTSASPAPVYNTPPTPAVVIQGPVHA